MIDLEQAQNLSDEQVAKMTLADQDYFLLIINRYKVKMFNFIMRITNVCPEDAEDLVQEIFLKVYLNLNDFDTDLKFSSWIYAIARNQVISNHRKLQVRAEGHAVTLEDANVEKIMSSFDVQKNMDMEFIRDKVIKVLYGLDKKYREILILKFLEEKNYKEISDIIKRPVGTVGSMLNKAREVFKKELEKLDIKL